MKYPELESSTLEFKLNIPKNDQIIKTIIGFCNQFGGKLVIGVDDQGEIIGLDEKDVDSMLEYLDKAIYESCSPPIIPLIYQRRFGDKIILVIQVPSGMNKPYYRQSDGLEKGTYIRLGRSTNRANADVIEELRWRSRGRFYDSLPVYHAERSDLLDSAIEEFNRRKKIAKDMPVTDELLHSYQLIVEEHGKVYPTTAGILLFGKKRQKVILVKA